MKVIIKKSKTMSSAGSSNQWRISIQTVRIRMGSSNATENVPGWVNLNSFMLLYAVNWLSGKIT